MADFGFNTTVDEACQALGDNIAGKTIVITGVSPNSMGAETARAIVARKPAQVILASHTESKLLQVLEALTVPEDTTVRLLVLDLASLDAVRKAVLQVSGWAKAVDAMIFTAGVMAIPEYTLSKDGIELHFAVNHLGHFLFANLLMEKLLAGNAPTVVNYSSEAHTRANPSFLDDLTYDDGKGYDKWVAYDNSKLCNIAFSVGLVKRFGDKNLRSFAVDPGVILTTALTRSVLPEDFVNKGWVDENGNLNPAIVPKSAFQGSSTGIIAAFDRSLSNNVGYYMADGAISERDLLPTL